MNLKEKWNNCDLLEEISDLAWLSDVTNGQNSTMKLGSTGFRELFEDLLAWLRQRLPRKAFKTPKVSVTLPSMPAHFCRRCTANALELLKMAILAAIITGFLGAYAPGLLRGIFSKFETSWLCETRRLPN